MIGAVSSANWVKSYGWKEGLFEQCVDKGAALPIPFGVEAVEGCSHVRGAGYIKVVSALMIIGIFTDFFGAVLTGLGLISTDTNKKSKFFRAATYTLIVAGLYFNLKLFINFRYSFEVKRQILYPILLHMFSF